MEQWRHSEVWLCLIRILKRGISYSQCGHFVRNCPIVIPKFEVETQFLMEGRMIYEQLVQNEGGTVLSRQNPTPTMPSSLREITSHPYNIKKDFIP